MQSSFVLWGALALASVLVIVVAVVLLRRRRPVREEGSSVFPPSSSGDGSAGQVRLLEGDANADQARIDALKGEVKSLRREADYAAQRGLDRRAERLRSLIEERQEQLARYEPADGADRSTAQGR